MVLYGLDLRIQGRESQVIRAHAVLSSLKPLWESGEPIAAVDLQTALTALDTGKQDEHGELARQVLTTTRQGRPLRARTPRQRAFINAIERHDLTLAIGPAGTGKTFLAFCPAICSKRWIPT